jgi:mRNA interferase MazF
VVNRGELWWVERPEYGRRPHLILTRDTAIPLLTRLVSVPATRTVRNLPTEVGLGPEDGLPTECVLSFDNITAVPRAYFVERIGALRGHRMHQVCKALAIATGCD